MMSKTVWDSLTTEQQVVVQAAMEQAAAASIDDAEKGDEKYMKMMEDAGMTVVRFDSSQLEIFAQAVRKNVWPRFEDSYGTDFMKQLLDSMQ